MAIRKIAQMGNPVLRMRAPEVPPEEIGSARIQTLIDDMIETMRDANGARHFDRERLAAEVRDGVISPQAASRLYGLDEESKRPAQR